MASYNLSKKEAAKLGVARVKTSGSSSSSISSGAPKAPSYGEFKFDSSKLVPQYQAEANALYQPQLEQIKALRGITTSQAEDAKVKTNDDFAQLLKRETENINRRGAFFSGGAIDQENRIGAEQGRALRDINNNLQIANIDYSGKEATIGQGIKDYVSSKVEGAYSSAYKMFQDTIANSLATYDRALGQFNTDRSFNQSVKESDRNYALSVASAARAGGGGVAGSDKELKATADALKKFGGNWDQTASYLADQGFDVSSGSVIDNELRRRNGLAPIATGKSSVNLSSTQVSSLADIDSTISLANKAKELATQVNTGPISGRVGKAAQATGAASNNFIDLNSQITNIKANFMKAISGAAVSEQEAQRLAQFLPDVTDSENVIQRKLTNLVDNLSQTRESLYKAAGGDNPYSVNSQQMINVFDVNSGQAGTIPENEFDPSKYIKR